MELLTSFAYDRWANLKWRDCLDAAGTPEEVRIMQHVLGAQKIWLLRVNGESPTTLDLPTLAEIEDWNDRWVAALANADLTRRIDYRRTTGEALSSTVGEIALHVINHGTYHRGEIRGRMGARGFQGFPETDRIRFTLENG